MFFWLGTFKGADTASAAALVLPNDGNYHHVTGTTTITSFAPATARGIGSTETIQFTGALTLTNSANLILKGGVNATTTAGDVYGFVYEGSNVWREVFRDASSSSAPQFAKIGLGQAVDSSAVMAATGQYYSAKVTDTVTSLAWTTDWNAGNDHYVVLASGTNVVTLNNPKDGGRYLIVLKQPSSGIGLVTWPASVLWPSGTAPTLTAATNKVDMISLAYDGTSAKYYAQAGLNF